MECVYRLDAVGSHVLQLVPVQPEAPGLLDASPHELDAVHAHDQLVSPVDQLEHSPDLWMPSHRPRKVALWHPVPPRDASGCSSGEVPRAGVVTPQARHNLRHLRPEAVQDLLPVRLRQHAREHAEAVAPEVLRPARVLHSKSVVRGAALGPLLLPARSHRRLQARCHLGPAVVVRLGSALRLLKDRRGLLGAGRGLSRGPRRLRSRRRLH
mmetsp:Transcript_122859/g.358577  ORF Transcript_122859/g.358577 Transcript_122859/m.358577 type:complete len:211 (+) Transcript_122859:595-1227(+)